MFVSLAIHLLLTYLLVLLLLTL